MGAHFKALNNSINATGSDFVYTFFVFNKVWFQCEMFFGACNLFEAIKHFEMKDMKRLQVERH